MRRLLIALIAAVTVSASYALPASAQPAAAPGCVVVVPTTTTTPPIPTETTTPPVPCEPAAPTSTSEPSVAVPPPPVPQPLPPAAPESTAVTTTAVKTTAAPTTTVPTTAESTTQPTTTPPAATTTTSPAATTSPAPATTTTTTASATVTKAPVARAAAASALDILTIALNSPLVGPSTITPGQTWTGTMNLGVLGVGLGGWTSTVSLTSPKGVNTGATLTPTAATYSAPQSACTAGLTGNSAAATIQLNGADQIAKRGGALCLTSWPATITIGIPASGVLADTYTATLTHSVF